MPNPHGLPFRKSLRESFEVRVPNRPDEGCWDWIGAVQHTAHGDYGYYRAGKGGPRYNATHLSLLFLADTVVPPGKQANHHCDRPICVRPDHLYVGDHRENMADAVARRRMLGNGGLRGETIGTSRLTDAQVIEMRARYQAGERQVALAAAYGLTQANVSLIVRGETWKHLLPPA